MKYSLLNIYIHLIKTIGISQHLIMTCKHQQHLGLLNRHLEKYKPFIYNHIEAHH